MRITAITPMKNEGPYILEWLAYHHLIGVNDFLVFTNACADGSDQMLERLDEMGIVRHMPNPSTVTGSTAHHLELIRYINAFPRIRRSDWHINIDADEFIAVRAGDGALSDLFAAAPDAQLISLLQIPYGSQGQREMQDALQIRQFTHAFDWRAEGADRRSRLGIKTLVRRDAPMRRIVNHAPKLRKRGLDDLCWVNGGGVPIDLELASSIPKSFPPNYWSGALAQINHYAVRSMDAYLVQSDRGNANRGSDANLKYWRVHDINEVEDDTALRFAERVEALRQDWLRDPELRDLHAASFAWHVNRIEELKQDPERARLRRRIERWHRRTYESPAEAAE